MKQHNIFQNQNGLNFIFIPIPHDCYDLRVIENNEWVPHEYKLICNGKSIWMDITIPDDKQLYFINTLNDITEIQTLNIIDVATVDVEEYYYHDYLLNEPVTDDDYKYSLQTCIIKHIGNIKENIAILKIN